MFMLLQLLIVCLIVAILAVRSSTDQTGDAKDKSEGGLGTSHDDAEDSLAVGRCDVGHEVAWDVCELSPQLLTNSRFCIAVLRSASSPF